MIIKTLIFVSLCLFGQVFGQSWLEGLLNARNEAQGTSEPVRPTILLTYEDQTTDCCDRIDILPALELSRCAKANANVSSTAIEQHKCILECCTTRTKIISSNGFINETQAYKAFKFAKAYQKNTDLIKEIIKNCTAAANIVQAQQTTPLAPGTCNATSTVLVACVAGGLLQRCPSSLRSDTTDCDKQFTAMRNGEVYLLPKLM